MTARLSYLSCEISVGAAALCIPRLGDSTVVPRFYCMQRAPFRRVRCYYGALRNSRNTIWRFIVLALCGTNERIVYDVALKALTSRFVLLLVGAARLVAILRERNLSRPWKSIQK